MCCMYSLKETLERTVRNNLQMARSEVPSDSSIVGCEYMLFNFMLFYFSKKTQHDFRKR